MANLTVPFRISQAVIPFMKRGGAATTRSGAEGNGGDNKSNSGPGADAGTEGGSGKGKDPAGFGTSESLRSEIEAQGEPACARGPETCVIYVGNCSPHRLATESEAHAATTAGMLGLMRAMAATSTRLGWGIRFNSLTPGFMNVKYECYDGDRKRRPPEATAQEEKLYGIRHGRQVAEAVEMLINAGFIREWPSISNV